MSFGKMAAALVAVAVVAIGLGAGATWWFMHGGSAVSSAEAAPVPDPDPRSYKYVSLEKVIVMLRGVEGEPAPHYLALDLVFKTPLEEEKTAREHLPLLRSVAVKALSTLTMDEASKITVDELTATMNKAYTDSYAKDKAGRPFADVMIGKLIVE
ncbi:flagellar basal body-associated FliL family protein [Steroidobacter sp.]|uniref:flagellar basal body-associated FliL family protein n=1 Tax=Steroidobacter sp. TaxID=1978227 RepID=UPI001A42C8BD|nr:flagellar basal body-associated FliL family protein [Steroidobacter sp.]MBL8265476.1 flagellar basal body-associated FliL family protein [Steroidobacter sp.]